jgi:shikimate dehydrogenase
MHFILLGDPVAQSKSPKMHAAAYRALGLDHTYEALRVHEAEIGAWVARLKRGEIGGINVTIPHKRAALQWADVIDASAKACDACNVLAYVDGSVVAYNTDVAAIVEELGSPASGTAIVLGRGGAARAAIAALKTLGATKIITRARAGGDEPLAPTGSEKDATWIVQCTSAGMTGCDPGEPIARAVDFSLAPHALAYDVIYEPRQTPFLVAAHEAGLRTKNGTGMLARQGAIAFEIWLDMKPPLDVMVAAIQ